MEIQLKQRVFRLFPSSFGSCRFGIISDVVENSIIPAGEPQNAHPPEPTSAISRVHSSITRPRSSTLSKNSKNEAPKFVSDTEGKRCPPVTPISPLNQDGRSRAKQSAIVKNSSSTSYGGWFSSEEDEAEARFEGENKRISSLSSDSSSVSRRKTHKSHRKSPSSEVSRWSFELSASNSQRKSSSSEMGYCSFEVTMNNSSCKTSHYRLKSSRSEMGRCTNEAPGSISRRKSSSSEMGRCLFEASASSINSSSFRSQNDRSKGKAHRITKFEREAQENVEKTAGSTKHFGARSGAYGRKSSESRRRRRGGNRSRETRRYPIVVGGRVEESYAVEKVTSDPYRDFRASMVEMIEEKEIYGAEDLQKLLQCFLSLNSSNHHRVILEVFAEIYQTLIAQ
ncbi:hypothetical protein NMG60_11027928 [Bertholletia excelsa]